MRGYYGVTCHFIVDPTLCSFLLACSRFLGSHTAEYIYEKFERIITNLEIANRISYIIPDLKKRVILLFNPPYNLLIRVKVNQIALIQS